MTHVWVVVSLMEVQGVLTPVQVDIRQQVVVLLLLLLVSGRQLIDAITLPQMLLLQLLVVVVFRSITAQVPVLVLMAVALLPPLGGAAAQPHCHGQQLHRTVLRGKLDAGAVLQLRPCSRGWLGRW